MKDDLLPWIPCFIMKGIYSIIHIVLAKSRANYNKPFLAKANSKCKSARNGGIEPYELHLVRSSSIYT